jgi:hypothetical protein
MTRADRRNASMAGARKALIYREIERQDGLAYARRYRETQPFKGLLDAIYGAEG